MLGTMSSCGGQAGAKVMPLSFKGTYEELQARLQVLEDQGKWTSLDDNQKQFRHDQGGILNWYFSTGTIQFQGKGDSKQKLREIVEQALSTPAAGPAAPPPGAEEPAQPLMSQQENTAGSSSEMSHADTEQPTPSGVSLRQRFSQSELVIGLVGAVGTELDLVINNLEKRLKTFNYEVYSVRISKEVIPALVPDIAQDEDDEFKRISNMMDAGNRARKTAKDHSILALGAAVQISALRRKDGNQPMHAPRRAYLINSLKHPEEVLRLREIYSQGFYLLGVHADKDRRRRYLIEEKRIAQQYADELIERDENEPLKHGQRVEDTFHLSDFFVHIDGQSSDRLRNSLWRILDILFASPHMTPTFDEYAMFLAFVASLRSADLSRQVGAVVADNQEILATGANDCPRYGGGLYWPEFDEQNQAIKDKEDGRDYTRGPRGHDANKIEQQKIIDDILAKAEEQGISRDKLRKALEASRIRDLTEFGRVVHAEMEALLSCARNHVSTRGAVLYCTTYPCHNCAKHIIAAGIERVVYVQPYQKSMAMNLHSDAISAGFTESTGETTEEKVCFEPFVGIGPRRFLSLFSMRLGSGYELKRKDDHGYVLDWKPEDADLRLQMLPSTYLDLELLALELFKEARQVIHKEEERDHG